MYNNFKYHKGKEWAMMKNTRRFKLKKTYDSRFRGGWCYICETSYEYLCDDCGHCRFCCTC